jgi:glycosyltransferase involved in cell wall biosynthesis
MRAVRSILFASGQPIFPAGWGGAETTVHDLLLALASKDVHVRALGAIPRGDASRVRARLETYFDKDAARDGESFRYNTGYPAIIASAETFIRELDICLADNRPDVVLTQALAWPSVVSAARKRGVPSILYVHGAEVLKGDIPQDGPDKVLYNSAFTRKWMADRFPHSGEIFHPPVDLSRYRVKAPGPRGALTLVNPLPMKGGHMIEPLARALPDRHFLAVEGWVLPPFLERAFNRLPNVEVVPWQHDIRTVYARTAVVLIPSALETFGRTPVEAAASGIPSISSGVGGLKEAIGDQGIFVELDASIETWVHAIRQLEDENVYRKHSEQQLEWAQRFDVHRSVPHFLEIACQAAGLCT